MSLSDVIKKGSGAPAPSALIVGGIGVDTLNKRLYFKAADGTVVAHDLNTPLGSIAATTVQGAINELAGSKAPIASPTFTGNVAGLGVATGTSFNAITGLSTSAGTAAGTATTGIETAVARGDHVHPIQTGVSGNAGTVTNGLYTTDKNASGGVAGLTLFKLNLKNAANTFTNFLTNATTAARTYTFPDKDITVAGLSDITGTNSGTNTGDQIIPETLPASDVSAWAKQATKPTYLASEVGAASLGANTFTDAQILSDKPLTQAMIKDCGYTMLDKGSSGTTTQTFDYTAGSHQKVIATGNHTIALSNFPPTGNLGELLIEYVNAGLYALTFPTINWIMPSGVTTTSLATYLAANTGRVALQSSGTDFILLWSRDAGTTVYGKLV
jgi:hypothetical protein